MDSVKAALGRSYAGIPGIAWAGIIAVGAWLILPHLTRGSSSPPGSSSTAGPSSDSVYGLGYAQGIQAAGAERAPAAAAQTVAYGAIPPSLAGRSPAELDHFINSMSWAQIKAQFGPDGLAYLYARAHNALPPASIGVGGAEPSRGSRSAVLMAAHHPLIKQRVRYAHYVRAVGGPGNHQAEVHRVAKAAGLHPARLLVLNPHHTGLIRIA